PSNVLWMALCFVILYRPMQHMILRITPHATCAHPYHALHAAITQLTTTLDSDVLNREFIAGVRSTFGQPALALYRAGIDMPDQLTLVAQERLPQLASTIVPGALIAQLCRLHNVTTSRRLAVGLDQQPLHADEEQTIHHPGVMVWGPIHHPHGALLGVLLLGARDDLDPYRTHDLHEIQRLLDAAALAFANSAAYTQQQHAEVTIRTLYQRLQEAQEATAAAIARELHDEIININVRLNIEAIQKVLSHIDDATLRAELELVLESEHTVIQALRLICEQLHPTGIDDPLGLPAVLRMQVERAQATWNGVCRLSVASPSQSVAAHIQHAAMQISREALTNAIKHATAATHILVELRNIPDANGCTQLIIRDNGQMTHPITAKPGHMGIRNMSERARMVGGQLRIDQIPGAGTAVVFTFVPSIHTKAEEPYDVPEVQQRS
ncbi:MAG: ATP-binding protein, partial [Roseiflexaceae bacterium]